jgi:DNA polymerase V
MFALIDCNNFYASCERLFRPDLRHTPIVVLSNNDGCVIARSNEAKAVGIKMGEAYFKMRGLCQEHKVQVFSSNYTLYGDLSHRVMSVIQDAWDNTEIYSIDEAFLDLTALPPSQHEDFCKDLQKKILKYTGIPTSIGIGTTKTLAKLANHVAKKELKIPVVNFSHQSFWLARIDVGDVWGVGRRLHKRLHALGISTAADLAAYDKHILKKTFSVVLMRTAMELQGIVCGGLEVSAPKQSIMSSRSFGTRQTEFRYLAQAISGHCAIAWEKMRAQHLATQHISVFVRSNPFREDLAQYSNAIGFRLVNPTDDIRLLTRFAKICLKKIYKKGIEYHKVGVLLGDLIGKQTRQLDLFNSQDENELIKNEKIMTTMEAINKKFGSHTMRLAAEGFIKPWAMKRNLKTPNYTTQWHELPIVYAH